MNYVTYRLMSFLCGQSVLTICIDIQHTKTLTFKDKLKQKECSHCFGNRVVPIWTSLPETVVSATSLYVFKKNLKQFDLHNAANLMF